MLQDRLLTCSEAADLLRIQVQTLRKWTSQRRIPFVKINGRAVRYRPGDLEKLVKAGLRPALGPYRTLEDRGDGEGGER